ncbi:hypothetical protein OH764_33150 (plasmid) [Burkholderia sp. M6-3]
MAASGGPRADVVTRARAANAVHAGAPAEQVIASNNLTHPRIAEIRQAAREAANGGLPADLLRGVRASIAVQERATAEQAIAANNLTHPRIAEVRQAAAREAASGGPGARSVASPLSQRDTRTREEIARTAALHRPTVQRGLDDLPSMRQSLGTIAGTEEQRQQARTFSPRLQEVEDALHQGNWDAVRDEAFAIHEDSLADYEADRITGVDYNTISEQLSIVFRRVPE